MLSDMLLLLILCRPRFISGIQHAMHGEDSYILLLELAEVSSLH